MAHLQSVKIAEHISDPEPIFNLANRVDTKY